MNPIITHDPLSETERRQVILAFLRTRGRKGAHPDEIHGIVSWAHQARVDHALLDLVLADTLNVDMTAAGGVTFSMR